MGTPQPGDYGDVASINGNIARVVWRFGATTDCSIDDLVKWHPRSKPHRYRVLFEQSRPSEDVSYTVVTQGGEAKAVWMASDALAREKPEYRAWAVEVQDLGTHFQHDPVNDLHAWDEVS
jgi:hypothetical protein